MQYIEDFLHHYVEDIGVNNNNKQILESINSQCRKGTVPFLVLSFDHRCFWLLFLVFASFCRLFCARFALCALAPAQRFAITDLAEKRGLDRAYRLDNARWRQAHPQSWPNINRHIEDFARSPVRGCHCASWLLILRCSGLRLRR